MHWFKILSWTQHSYVNFYICYAYICYIYSYIMVQTISALLAHKPFWDTQLQSILNQNKSHSVKLWQAEEEAEVAVYLHTWVCVSECMIVCESICVWEWVEQKQWQLDAALNCKQLLLTTWTIKRSGKGERAKVIRSSNYIWLNPHLA